MKIGRNFTKLWIFTLLGCCSHFSFHNGGENEKKKSFQFSHSRLNSSTFTFNFTSSSLACLSQNFNFNSNIQGFFSMPSDERFPIPSATALLSDISQIQTAKNPRNHFPLRPEKSHTGIGSELFPETTTLKTDVLVCRRAKKFPNWESRSTWWNRKTNTTALSIPLLSVSSSCHLRSAHVSNRGGEFPFLTPFSISDSSGVDYGKFKRRKKLSMTFTSPKYRLDDSHKHACNELRLTCCCHRNRAPLVWL